jgi:pyruvate/2-oxoglutarate dehydrogenase complex dihydrolipoamide acyltransferase (E2) component
MTTLGFSYDHRVLDGATADAFCAAVKQNAGELSVVNSEQ